MDYQEANCAAVIDEILPYIRRSAAAYPLLTAEEEIKLGRLIRAWQDHPDGPDGAPAVVRRRGQRALERFTACNMRLAINMARRFEGRGVPLEDLIQVAAMGLHKAYLGFDPTLGYRSSSYATWFAMQRCQVLVAQSSSTVRLPAKVRDDIRRLAQAGQRCAEAGNHLPTDKQLAAEMGVEPRELQQLKAFARLADTRSLDTSRKESNAGGGIQHACLTEDPSQLLLDNETRRLVRSAIANCPGLTCQHRYILSCRFLEANSPSLPRLASSLQMSRRLVKAMEEEAIWRLRTLIRACQQPS